MKAHIIKLLRWSEKYTRTDMTYLVKGGAWLLLSQALLFFLSFGLIWVFANLMTQELYGQYRFLITVVSLLAIASLPGMKTAVIRAVAKGKSGILPMAITSSIKWGLLGSLGSLIGAGYYFWQDDASLGMLFLLIALFVPFFESYTLIYSYHIGRTDYRNFTTSTVIQRFFVIICTIGAIVISQNIFVILCTYLISTVLSHYLIYLYTVKRFPLSTETDTETIKYGKELSLMSVVSAISGHLDKIALWYLAGPAQVAIYTIAMSLPKEISGAFSQIGILALPKMATREKNQLRQSLLRKVLIFFIASLPLLLAYILAAPFIFEIFLPQYLDTVFYSQIAAVIIALTPVTLLTQYFQATMHTRALYAMQFILPAVLIALFFILIPLYGTLGAILSVIGRLLVSLFLLLYFFITDSSPTISTKFQIIS